MPPGTKTIARDTVFSAVMIVLNGIIGFCLVVGARRYKEQAFQLQGAVAALAVLGTLVVLAMLLPNYTISTPGPYYSTLQLVFVGVVSLILYGVFLLTQTILHRNYFVEGPSEPAPEAAPNIKTPSNAMTLFSGVLLIIALIAVVALASPIRLAAQSATRAWSPPSWAVIIAALVLTPEALASVRRPSKSLGQSQSRCRFGDRVYWAHSSGCRLRVRHSWQADHPRAGDRWHGLAHVDAVRQHSDTRDRKNDSPARRRAPRDIRGVFAVFGISLILDRCSCSARHNTRDTPTRGARWRDIPGGRRREPPCTNPPLTAASTPGRPFVAACRPVFGGRSTTLFTPPLVEQRCSSICRSTAAFCRALCRSKSSCRCIAMSWEAWPAELAFLRLPVDRRVADHAAGSATDEHGRRAVAEDRAAGTGTERGTADRADAGTTAAAFATGTVKRTHGDDQHVS